MLRPASADAFIELVYRLRATHMERRDRWNMAAPGGPPRLAHTSDCRDGTWIETYWRDNGTPQGQFVRLFDRPGTLSGDILRLLKNLPPLSGHVEIDGDSIRMLAEAPPMPPTEEYEDDSEDLTEALAPLPIITPDPALHFVKKGKYRSEIENLLKCQQGACPGLPLSPSIVRLLGRSPDGELVLEKHKLHYFGMFPCRSVAVYKRWIKQFIAALQCLHSLGIVHRDIKLANLLFSADGARLIICDLEGRWGQYFAPEIMYNNGLEAGWTEKSDIYDLGVFIRHLIYGNNPINRQVKWPVPPPFDDFVAACTRAAPEDRPTLEQLSDIVDRIPG
ncbi:MAG: hypothetical protein M1826_000145 [Phylliscum demangeonii]|nr:MAG: hypothetical protein M1826_000145 [Phylliscum demangeonii]